MAVENLLPFSGEDRTEFPWDHSERLWKRLTLHPDPVSEAHDSLLHQPEAASEFDFGWNLQTGQSRWKPGPDIHSRHIPVGDSTVLSDYGRTVSDFPDRGQEAGRQEKYGSR